MSGVSVIDLRLGDCLEIMHGLPDGCVDAVITDFPYGVGIDYGIYEDTQDNLKALIGAAIPEMRRIAKRVAFTCGIANIYLYPPTDWILAWACSGGGSNGKWGFNTWQPILVYGKDPYLQNRLGRRPDLIYLNEKSQKNGHPCPKPLGVMRKIVERISPFEDEIILDPFMGSGTTGVACVKLNRSFIGIEINPDYFAIAQKRIAEAQRQMVLL